MAIQTLEDVQLSGKRVLVRCDFNVPLKDGVITDDSRINAAIPTIQHLVDQSARAVSYTHLTLPTIYSV